MKLSTVILVLQCLILIIGGYLIYTNLARDTRLVNDADYWRKQAFKTDTVRTSTNYSERIPYKEMVAPQIVYVPQPYIPESTFKFSDSLITVIEKLKGKQTPIPINIKPSYFLQYPESKKLIGALFSKDSIELDLLGIDGAINSQRYFVDYSAFKYNYVNNSINALSLNTRTPKNNDSKKLIRYDGTYLFYEKDFLNKYDNLHATMALDVWKLRFQGFAGFPLISDDKKLKAGIRIGFRLF